MRRAAFDAVVRHRSDVEVLQVVNIPDWSDEVVAERFPNFYSRYREVNLIWSGSGRLTKGLLNAMKSMGLRPGVDLFLNSYGMNYSAFTHIEQASLTGSAGGHFVDGVWALVLVHDFLNGHDFSSESVSYSLPMTLITQDNITLFTKLKPDSLTKKGLQNVDFKRFSKVYNQGLSRYRFALSDVLQQLQ